MATAVCYAKDAMTGLRLMNQLSDPTQRGATLLANTYVSDVIVEEAESRATCAGGRGEVAQRFARTWKFRPSLISTAKCASCPI
jgi:hypothetical protein